MYDSRRIARKFLGSFLFPFLKNIAILAFFQAVGIRLFDKHLVYSLPDGIFSCFQYIDIVMVVACNSAILHIF